MFSFLSSWQCQEESQQQVREFQEYINQMEEDGDLEIQDIRLKYEQRLREEKLTNSKLKIESDTTKKSVCVCIVLFLAHHHKIFNTHFTFLLVVHNESQ